MTSFTSPNKGGIKSKNDLFDAVAKGKMTWAEAMGLTRSEAYGIAFVAHRWFEHGQHVRAKRIMEGLIVANPKDAYFHALLGAMEGRQGHDDEALKLYNTALKLDPKNLTARVNRADLLLRKGALDKALDDLVAATKIDPRGKTPLGKRALALARATSSALHAILKARPQHKKPAPR
jgi:predicted Zn-dependent protease